MNPNKYLARGAGVVLLSLLGVNAWALGTDAGTTVTNSVTLQYQVNAVPQTELEAEVSFVVDRALAVTVVNQDSDVVPIISGQTYSGNAGIPALNFDVTNISNDDLDLLIGVVDQDGIPVTGFNNQGPDAFNGSNVIVAIDTDGNGVYDDGVDQQLTQVGNHFSLPASEMTRDEPLRLLVVVDVPSGLSAGDQATYTLVAALADGTAVITNDDNGNATPGGTAAPVAGFDPTLVQDVFADAASMNAEDVAYDFLGDAPVLSQGGVSIGQHSATGAFVIARPDLDISKVVEVLWDPINLNRYASAGSNTLSDEEPKAIPGALLMYVIGVSNDASSNYSVSDLEVTDELVAELLEGNDTGESPGDIYLPESVTLTLNGSPVSLDLPATPDLDQVTVVGCDGSTSSESYSGGSPAVDVLLGACEPGETGLVVYFVTLE